MRKFLMFLLLTAPLAAQDDTALRRGEGELAISGGVAMFFHPYSGYNSFRFGYAAGLTRNVALIGGYSMQQYFAETECRFPICVGTKLRGHEYTVGGRVSFPLRGVTPYALGALGGLRQGWRVESGTVAFHDGITYFVVGGGAGMDVRVNRYFGFQAEARAMKSPRRDLWYVQPMVGIYIRHR